MLRQQIESTRTSLASTGFTIEPTHLEARNTFRRLRMPKRSHLVLDDDDYQDEQVSPEERSSTGIAADTGVHLNLLRLVLTRYARNQKIRKDHLSPILHRHNLKGNIIPWINVLKKECERLFGITIFLSGNEIVVKSYLQLSSRNVLDQLLKGEDVRVRQSNGDLNGSFHLLASHKRREIIVNTPETILGGVIMLIVSLIVINENRMRESDLSDALNEFGLSEKLSSVVANLNKSTQDILSELVRREYIAKIIAGAGKRNSQVDFCLGKATLREIEPNSILMFLKNLFDQEEMQLKCLASVQRCFPDASLSGTLTRG